MEQQQNKTRFEISRTDIKIDSVGAATREAMAQIEGIVNVLDLEPLGHS